MKTKSLDVEQQLQLFREKEQEVDIANKKSQLELFNSMQGLAIWSDRDEVEDNKEQVFLTQLQEKRSAVAEEIENMVERQEQGENKLGQLRQRKKRRAEVRESTEEDF